MAKIFFSGIGGSGMSAMAGFMAEKGHTVAGSDRLFDTNPGHQLCKILTTGGITIFPQDASGIDTSYDCIVFSTAVEENQREFVRAKESGIPIRTRPEYLREILSGFRTIAVAGTSGKSTIAGMLAFLMDKLGMGPNFIGGGRVKQFRTGSNPGNFLSGTSELFVFEACESDGTIVHYKPAHTIISNLSLDHHPIQKTAGMFEALNRNTRELLIINADDDNLRQCRFDKPVRFSVDTPSEYRAEAVAYQPFGTDFVLRDVPFRLSLPGKHNLYNALSCLALLSETGIALGDIAGFLASFSGIERRFDICLNNGKSLVIDDYAHNPEKIASLMETMKRISRKICYLFQPHGYGPVRLMRQGYIETFKRHLREDDHLILLPIFYAGGTAQKDVSSEDLLYEIVGDRRSGEVLPERSLIFDRLKEWDTYVVSGARDESLSDFAREIAKRLK